MLLRQAPEERASLTLARQEAPVTTFQVAGGYRQTTRSIARTANLAPHIAGPGD